MDDLTELDMSMNQLGAIGVAALCNSLGNKCPAGCRRCQILREETLWPQAALHCSALPADSRTSTPQLAYLDLSATCAGGAADSIATALSRCKNISHLALGMNHLYASSPTVISLPTTSHLQFLDLVCAQGLCEAIGQAPCLVQLDLRSNRLEGCWAPALAHALAVTCTLRMLNLSENRLGPDDALFLSEVHYILRFF